MDPTVLIALVTSLVALYSSLTNLSARVSRLNDAKELLELAKALDPKKDSAKSEALRDQAYKQSAIAWAHGEVRDKRYVLRSVVLAATGAVTANIAVDSLLPFPEDGTGWSSPLFTFWVYTIATVLFFGYSAWCLLYRDEYVTTAAEVYPNGLPAVPACSWKLLAFTASAALFVSGIIYAVLFSLTSFPADTFPGYLAPAAASIGLLIFPVRRALDREAKKDKKTSRDETGTPAQDSSSDSAQEAPDNSTNAPSAPTPHQEA